MANKTYIGDGIYAELEPASFGPDTLILTTENGIEATNRIIIEFPEWQEIQRFMNPANIANARNIIESEG